MPLVQVALRRVDAQLPRLRGQFDFSPQGQFAGPGIQCKDQESALLGQGDVDVLPHASARVIQGGYKVAR